MSTDLQRPLQGERGRAWIFTFPYWLFVDTAHPPVVQEITVGRLRARIYPPFRSGAPNFLPMPYVDPHAIPFLPSVRMNIAPDYRILKIALIPHLCTDASGQARVTAAWGDAWEDPPVFFPMDSLRIDLLQTEDEFSESSANVDHVVESLLEHLRWRTKQWWISRSIAGLLGFARNDFPITDNGTPLDQPAGVSRCQVVLGFECPITLDIWREALLSLERQELAREYDLRLLDAYWNLSQQDIRAAIIDASIAVEQAKDITFVRLWRARSSKEFRRGRVLRGYDITHHMSRDLERLVGRSLEREHPDLAEEMENLWFARGNVAHGGPALSRHATSTQPLDLPQTRALMDAADATIRWLEQV